MEINELEMILADLCIEHEEIEYSFYKEGSVLNSFEFDADLDDYGYLHFLIFEEAGAFDLLKKILENMAAVNENMNSAVSGRCVVEMEFVSVSGKNFEIDVNQGGRPLVIGFDTELKVLDVRED